MIKEKKESDKLTSSQKTLSDQPTTGDSDLANPDRTSSLIESLMRATSDKDKTFLTDSEILGNVKVFFLAGSDTTAVVITWAMYELCLKPELLKQVQEEVDRAMKGSTDYALAVAERKLPLCAACFLETIRLRGPAPFVILNPAGTTSITLSNGIVVNPGDDLNFNLDAIHTDPKVTHLPRTAYMYPNYPNYLHKVD